jgi:uncharacterized membrane protein
MRRILVFLLLITGILTVILGIVESQDWHEGLPEAHIAMAAIFILTCIAHIIMNRKAVMRHLKGK